MKPLRTLAIAAANKPTDTLTVVVSQFADIRLHIESDVENSIEQMSLGNYDLLIIDKTLKQEDHNKLNKVSEMLFPDAAVTTLFFEDEDFIRFKLSGLLSKWRDAQQDTTRIFFDGLDS